MFHSFQSLAVLENPDILFDSPGHGLTPGAVWVSHGIVLLISELKNEDGLMGNAPLQSVLDVPHIAAQSETRSLPLSTIAYC